MIEFVGKIMDVGLPHYLVVAAILFTLGLVCVLTRGQFYFHFRNGLGVCMVSGGSLIAIAPAGFHRAKRPREREQLLLRHRANSLATRWA